jgi:hypothetical protein
VDLREEGRPGMGGPLHCGPHEAGGANRLKLVWSAAAV